MLFCQLVKSQIQEEQCVSPSGQDSSLGRCFGHICAWERLGISPERLVAVGGERSVWPLLLRQRHPYQRFEDKDDNSHQEKHHIESYIIQFAQSVSVSPSFSFSVFHLLSYKYEFTDLIKPQILVNHLKDDQFQSYPLNYLVSDKTKK